MITFWYAKSLQMDKGIIQYRQASFCPNGKSTCFDTLLTDLTESEEEIMNRISKNTRYKIRRAEKENVKTIFYEKEALTEKEISAFCTFFEEFWKSKGVAFSDIEELHREIKDYAAQNAFVISAALIEDKPCVYHTYVVDNETARLYNSASLYRTEDAASHNLIGMANRYLHREDMFHFKKEGLKTYDWGGAGTGEEVASITEFKKSFGGSPAVFYDFTRVNGMKAKAVDAISTFKHLIKGK